MFIQKETILEIDNIFKTPIPLAPIDEKNETKNMDSLYELEDYIKENIYEKNYPNLLKNDNQIGDGDGQDYSIEAAQQQNESENIEEDEKEEENNNALRNDQKFVIENGKNEQSKKYKITQSSNNIIQLPENYSTDDEDEYNSLKILFEDKSQEESSEWELCISKEEVKVFVKLITLKGKDGNPQETVIFRLSAIIDYPASTINKYINDFEFRKEFDGLYKQAEIISEENISNNFKIIDMYLFLKMPFIFSDRDFVVRKKIWSNYNNIEGCTLVNLHSITHPKYPEKNKPVRAEFYNRSVIIVPKNDNQCELIITTHLDMKIPGGVSMMKTKGASGQESWFNKFIENVKRHEN